MAGAELWFPWPGAIHVDVDKSGWDVDTTSLFTCSMLINRDAPYVCENPTCTQWRSAKFAMARASLLERCACGIALAVAPYEFCHRLRRLRNPFSLCGGQIALVVAGS